MTTVTQCHDPACDVWLVVPAWPRRRHRCRYHGGTRPRHHEPRPRAPAADAPDPPDAPALAVRDLRDRTWPHRYVIEGGATVRVHHTGNAECAACPGLRDCAHIRAVTEHLRVGTPPRSDDERQDRDHEDDA